MTDPALPGRKLDLPVPPDLTAALGYPGSGRYVVFYYEADDDQVMWNDGNSAGHGNNWAWQLYTRHRAVEPLLRGFDLTSFDSELCVVFDQEKTRASVATGDQAAMFLREHRPPLLPSPPMAEEPQGSLVEQITQGWQEVQIDSQEVMRAMAEQQARVGRVMSWLDMAPVPPAREGRGA